MSHPQTHILLRLLANQLRDIHSQLEDKILSNKRHNPQWQVRNFPQNSDTDPEQFVAELVPLDMLVEKLEQCARDELGIIEGHQAAALTSPMLRE
jgi:hypothetical protein